MPKFDMRPLIFTDLDGTLLDHDTYSAEPAASLIRTLHEQSVADVIPVTSKTQMELSALDCDLPFVNAIKVSENGSVIKLPANLFAIDGGSNPIVLGVPYRTILAAINALPTDVRREVVGFADMTAEEVANCTGLSVPDARRAKARDATEPFLWSGNDAQMTALKDITGSSGIHIQQGGRFFHFTGAVTKRQAIKEIMYLYREKRPHVDYISIALGDGPNDLEMIETADYGVVIPNNSGAAIESGKPHVRVAKQAGPKGWASAVTDILRQLNLI
jgi:mannosyl-3-phosphoglycerate phosphatase family protein